MLCLLGSPAIRLGDVLRPLKLRPKALALLVRAALEGPVSRVDLADLIFPEAEAPRAALRWHLNYLRAQLPEPIRNHLVITPEHVGLDAPTDVEVFRRGAKRILAAPHDPEAAGVLALYRGDLCTGLTVSASAVFDTWLYVEQESLRRVFRQATVAVARQRLTTGDPGPAIEPLAQLVSVDPYYAEGHSLLIEASEVLGRREAAAAAYQRYQRILRQELRIEPPLSLIRRFEPDAPIGRVPPDDSLIALSQLTLHIVDWPGAEPPILAARSDCSGLILLEGVIGDRAFTENAAARVINPWSKTLELRVGGFEEYLTRVRAEQVRSGVPSDDAERFLERTIRYELAPLPDGTYRRRALRAAFEETWASLLQSDSLGALARVRCPTLIVQAPRPWIEGRPYLTDEIIAAQREAAPHAQVFVAHQSTHPMLVRDPEPGTIEALRRFFRHFQVRQQGDG